MMCGRGRIMCALYRNLYVCVRVCVYLSGRSKTCNSVCVYVSGCPKEKQFFFLQKKEILIFWINFFIIFREVIICTMSRNFWMGACMCVCREAKISYDVWKMRSRPISMEQPSGLSIDNF